ncbi:probable mannitol dehydrogenase [Eucalyptus grandis]|uniref:probable mannitol dehydrogenase n=1 Tax=Eucalyptus grandis TaxID=71139 RepID=UPI00192EC468|nr:probable mannitol dehydrogenase [Eucalyptus grandis]
MEALKLNGEEQMQRAFGYAARDSSGVLSPFSFTRRANGDHDITMKILYCGICHSDLHIIKNEHGISSYPIVPGHEIVGVVTQAGGKVNKFKVGDKVGVGCLIGSCGECDNCHGGLENYCPKPVYTYTIFESEGNTKRYGGYSDILVVDEHFAVRIPDAISLTGCAPLLCAGITVYSPIRHFGLDRPRKRIGVVGLGGLGHLAVKFGKAFGAEVTVISTSESKRQEAIEELKADSFILSHDMKQMQAAIGTMDGIIDTVSATHPLKPLLDLLRTDGKLIMLSAPDLETPAQVPLFPLFGRKSLVGSMCGGIKETQEMMDFAAEHGITSNVEVVAMDYVNEAMDRLARGDVRYRFVIDIANTLTNL